jgi:hypothetical protein
VRESDGVARPEGEGFAIESLETYPDDPVTPVAPGSPPKPIVRRRVVPPRPTTPSPRDGGAPAAPAVTAKPLGSVKDGFTKLH